MDLDIGYRDLRNSLGPHIELHLQHAHDMSWPFLQEEHITMGSHGYSDLFLTFSDWNPTFGHLTNYDVAKWCIQKAMDDQLYQDAMDLIFVVDRFAYWKDKSETRELLDRAQSIITQFPGVAVPPQLILRKIRSLEDGGDYQGADELTTSVLSVAADCMDKDDKELKICQWQFTSRKHFVLSVALFLMLKGQIQIYLAQPVDAAVYLVASARLAGSISNRTNIGGQCFQLLFDVLLDMGASQRDELQNFLMFEASPDKPLLENFTEIGDQILNQWSPGDIYFPRVTRIDLMRVFETKQIDSHSETFRVILRHLKAGMPECLEWAILENRDVARDFAYSIFNVYLVFNFLRQSNESLLNAWYSRHEIESVLKLSIQLFLQSCGKSSEKDLAYFKLEMNKVRTVMLNSLGKNSMTTLDNEAVDRYPVLRRASPEDLLRSFKNLNSSNNLKNITLVSSSNVENRQPTVDAVAASFIKSGYSPTSPGAVDPVAMTLMKGGLLPSIPQTVDPLATTNMKSRLLPGSPATVDPVATTHMKGGLLPSSPQTVDPVAKTDMKSRLLPSSSATVDPVATTFRKCGALPSSSATVDPVATTHMKGGLSPSSPRTVDPLATTHMESGLLPSSPATVDPVAMTSIKSGLLPSSPATVDPVATTLLKSGVLPSNMQKFNPKLFQFAGEDISPCSHAVSADVVMGDGLVYQSLLNEPVRTVDGFSAPQKLLATKEKLSLGTSSPSEQYAKLGPASVAKSTSVSLDMILNTKLSKNTIYQANVIKYYTVEDQWRYQKTLVFVHDELQLAKNKKGTMRDVIRLQYLHQDHSKAEAIYLGKRYRLERLHKPKTYCNDVIMHQISLRCVARFNKQLQPYPRFANRIRMVPVVHMEILDETGHILEFLNVEPYICANFTKFTNNLDSVNPKVDSQLLLAFSHFTWYDSDRKFMVTDLQGFVHEDPRIATILTDPAINSEHLDYLGITNMGKKGFDAFWTKQHPTCNEVCQLLGLQNDRPECADIAEH